MSPQRSLVPHIADGDTDSERGGSCMRMQRCVRITQWSRACLLKQALFLSSTSVCYYRRSSHPGGECHTLAPHQLLTRCSGPSLHLVALRGSESLRGRAEGRVEESGP